MTQLDLAHAAGLSGSYVVRLEAGRANPRATTLARIADALGIEPTSLFNDEAVGLGMAVAAKD